MITDKVKVGAMVMVLLFGGLWVERLFAAAEARGELLVHLRAATVATDQAKEANQRALEQRERAEALDTQLEASNAALQAERDASAILAADLERMDAEMRVALAEQTVSLRMSLTLPQREQFDRIQDGWVARLDAKDRSIENERQQKNRERARANELLLSRDQWKATAIEERTAKEAALATSTSLRLALDASERARTPGFGIRLKANAIVAVGAGVLGYVLGQAGGGAGRGRRYVRNIPAPSR
jgi:hypothetical protein